MSDTSVGEIGLDLVVNSSEFQREIPRIERLAKKAGSALAGAFATKKLVEFGKKCIDLGSDLAEVQNVVDVTFPSMTRKVDEFAQSAASSFGLSETMAKKFSGTFGAMAKAFGFAESEAYEMSTTLTGLAGDVASFYNITQDEAYTKLKSVFTGETESLKELGVVMTQSALDSYALANGFNKTTSAMTEAEKVALRYQFVQSQLSAANGDFARTSESWANQCRILSLQLESIMASIGQGLINLFTPAIRIINIVIGKLATLANAFKAFTELITGGTAGGNSTVADLSNMAESATSGLTDASSAADGLNDSTKNVGVAAKKAAKEMQALMGFDVMEKLPQTSQDSDSGSGSGAAENLVGAAVDFGTLAQGETILEETDTRLEKLLKRCNQLKSVFKSGFRIGFGDSEKKIDSIQKSLERIGTKAKGIFTDPEVANSADKWANHVMYALGKLSGSAASVGLTIADNLLSGIDKYVQGSERYIKKKLISILDVSAEIADLKGSLWAAWADIFDVFDSDSAKGITAKLIGLFSDGFLGAVDLGLKFVRDISQLVITPLISNVEGIKTAFEGILSPINAVLGTLYESLHNTLSSVGVMYDEHIAPFVQSMTDGLSSIVSVVLDAWNTYISPVLSELAEKFDTVWNEHIQPLLNTFIGLVGQIFDTLKALWEELIQPLAEEFIQNIAPALGKAISGIGKFGLELLEAFADVAKGILSAFDGVLKFFTGVFTQDWQLTTEGLQAITEGLGSAVDSVFGFIEDHVLKPFDDFLQGVFEKDWSESFGVIGEAMNLFFDIFEPIWDSVKGTLEDIIGFITGAFRTDWDAAWETIVESFGTIFEGIKSALKAPINVCVGMLNGLIEAVNSVLEAIESKMKFDFTIPSPFGGTIVDYHWQAKLPRIKGKIKELAEGGFVKANTPQLALIGDNRHQGEVVAPEDKLRQLAIDAVKMAGGSGVTREELEQIINNAVMRIVSALAGMGFYVDSEELAKVLQTAEQALDSRFNPVIPM